MLKRGFLIYLFLKSFILIGQDPQFSQYYAAPLYLNPAFTGSSGCTRFTSNYRNQWFGLNKPYNTFAFSADHNIDKFNSGIGFQFLSDQIGSNGISTLDASVLYSYRLDFSKKHSLRAGIQAGVVSKHLDILQLSFPDQFSDDGFQNTYSYDYYNKKSRTYYADISGGLLYYSSHFWFGFSAHHLNQPNQSFTTNDGNDQLPAKFSVHSGYQIKLNHFEDDRYDKRAARSKSLSPTFLLKKQGAFTQLDLGLYFLTKPFFIGLWYRGIPLRQTVNSFTNRDALVFQGGIRFVKLSFGYSFDYTISKLANFSRGTHEISLGYVICGGYKKPKERLQTLPCPDFYNNELMK
jgi:type IX secretion system PorP/SprF family membrane protein